jgi:hypothetical protein
MRWAYGVTRSFVDHGREMFLARKVQWRTKASAALFASGYVMVACVLPLIVLGVLNAMTDPALAAGAQSWQILAIELARSILVTGGLIIATISAGLVSGFGFGRVTHMLLSSLTIGLLLVVFISVGIGKAVTGQSMPWFMLKKAGNLQRL